VAQYLYEHIESGEIVEITQSMRDEHVYNGEDGTEIGQWRRVFTVPRASIDTKLDPRDKNAFIRRTEKYTKLGEMQDISREMSEKRAAKDGKDGVKEAWLDNYEKTRNGKRHFERIPKVVETPHIKIDLNK
jgi:hypothetical protein